MNYVDRRFQIKTKIICTIGPKSSDVDTICQLRRAGMNVARLNFSHGTHEYHQNVINNIRLACQRFNNPTEISILLDTKGPEIRTGVLKDGKNVILNVGQKFILYADESKPGDEFGVHTTYGNLYSIMVPGDKILVDDGSIGLEVVSVDTQRKTIECIVENTGELGERKGVNLPGKKVDLDAVTSKDIDDINFGIKNEVDFIAASFVRTADNVRMIRKLISGTDIKIISKIENREGLENFDEIISVSDGIMVARGDLGVEVPVEKVYRYQKLAIKRCNIAGKPVITATQMLESMIQNPRPTRAEATDVANAVLDGSDCVMLSGETAKGMFPIRSVQVMFNICRESECDVQYQELYDNLRKSIALPMSVGESIAASAVRTSWDVHATLIIVLTETGNMAMHFAKHRPVAPVIAVTPSEKVARHCAIYRGIYPLIVESMSGSEKIVLKAMKWGKQKGMVQIGDPVVVTSGVIEGRAGTTNMMRVLTCRDS